MFPKTVSIEVTNHCNNQCLICPHGYNFIQKKGYITKDQFMTILERIDHMRDGLNLELHGIGEPLLHTQIYEFTEIASERGFSTSICTNAILLTKKAAKRLVDSGITKIVFSLETRENYERIRCNNIYDTVLENVLRVADEFPEIELEIFMIVVGNEQGEEFDEFKKQFGRRRLVINEFRPSNWCGKIPLEGLESKKGSYVKETVCPLFEHYCAIDYEGFVRHCYLDFNSEYLYGDLNSSSFDSIWHSKKRQDIIEKMKSGLYNDIIICSECVFPFVENKDGIQDKCATMDDLKRPEMQLLSKIGDSRRKGVESEKRR